MPAPPKMTRHKTKGNWDVERVQDQIQKALEPMAGNPMIKGKLIKDVAIPAAPGHYTLNHGLGQHHNGWHVVRKNNAGDIYETGSKDDSIELSSTGDVTATLWVF